jgi:replicative DNA helicase
VASKDSPEQARGSTEGSFIPTDKDAEAHILAALLTTPEVFADVSELLVAEDFGVLAHSLIYDAIMACDIAGKPVDVITVADELRRAKHLTKAGGLDYLAALAGLTDVSAHVSAHADIVRDKSLLRRLVMAGRVVSSSAMEPGIDAMDALEKAESEIFVLGAQRTKSTLTPMPQAVAETLAELAKVKSQILLGHPTGFIDLDRLTGGFQGGQLITLAARPAMGKSAFALQLATHIASATGLMVPFISYEMSLTELTMRVLAVQMNYDLHKLRQGDIPSGMERDLAVTAERIAELPMFIDDNPPGTIAGVRSSMRRLARRGQIGAIFVDYLQLMEGDRRSKEVNRTQEVSDISRGLKRLASELDVPIIALSQLNRQLEQRPNKRPMLSDLRESGSIEQDSSLVMFIHREHVYDANADPQGAECIIAKQRNGPAGPGTTVKLRWHGPSASFRGVDRNEFGTVAGNGSTYDALQSRTGM